MQQESNQLAKQSTVLDSILSNLSGQNERYVKIIQMLEGVGHRIKDTNSPEKEAQAERVAPDGLLQKIEAELDYFESQNNRLENFYNKLLPLL